MKKFKSQKKQQLNIPKFSYSFFTLFAVIPLQGLNSIFNSPIFECVDSIVEFIGILIVLTLLLSFTPSLKNKLE